MENGKYAPRPGNIPGVAVNIGGHMFVLAPLGLRLAREFSDKAKAIEDTPENHEQQWVDYGVQIILASLQRNYPEMTTEELEPLLDTMCMREAAEAINNQSGLKRVTPGELKPGS